jgi:hypothetical protein
MSESIWGHLFGWNVLFSWIVVAWAEGLLLGAVLAMIGIGYAVPTDSSGPWLTGAQICFSIAALLFLVKVAEIAIVTGHPFWERAIFTIALFSVVGLITVQGIRGINKIRPLKPILETKSATIEELVMDEFDRWVVATEAGEPHNTSIIIWTHVKNLGPPSIIDHFELLITLPDGRKFAGERWLITKKIVVPIYGHNVDMYPEDCLGTKHAVTPLITGAKAVGWLYFKLHGITRPEVFKPTTLMELSFQDVTGKKYTVSQIMKGNASGNEGLYYPGTHVPDGEEKKEGQVSSPAPQAVHVRLASQEQIVSVREGYPYGLKVVLQTDLQIQPVAILLECDGVVGEAVYGPQGGGMIFNATDGMLEGLSDNWYAISWDTPAFTPDKPVIITLYSKAHLTVKSFQMIPWGRLKRKSS